MKRNLVRPADAAWLARTMQARRDQFAGWSMEAAPGSDPGAGDPAPAGDPKPGDEPLGEPGKKALDAERDARKSAEGQLTALRGEFDAFKTALTQAVGVDPKKGDEGDALTQVQQQLASMQRENAVFRVAAENGITDKDDLDLLRSATDEQAMSKLAGRLAAKADATPGTPKPDATQGGTGGSTKPDVAPGVARLRQAYADTAK